MLTPKGKEAEEGGCLPPARLELSKSLQMHLGLPGQAPVLPAAWPGGGVSPRSRRPPSGAVPPPPALRGGDSGSRARARPVKRS